MSTNLAGKKEGKFSKKQRIMIVATGVIIFAVSVCLSMWLFNKNDVSVDKTLTTLYEDEKFVEAEYEEKKEIVEELLATLYKQGLIREKAVYDEKHRLYTYQYKDGTLGGVSLQELDKDLNVPGSGKDVVPVLSKSTGEQFKVVVLNAFEDIKFRTNYYETLYSDWEDQGIGVTLDNYVTIGDLKAIDQYDAAIFSMHGTVYEGTPILSINEKVTIKTDKRYRTELKEEQSIARVYCADGDFHYWVFPKFFSENYEEEAFEEKVIYSESCAFFGCDCTATEIDCSYSNVFLELSAECVFGYHNSVGAQYSRNVMKYTFEKMFEGANANDALLHAIEYYGKNDNYEDISKDKYLAYPVLKGNLQAVFTTDLNSIYIEYLHNADMAMKSRDATLALEWLDKAKDVNGETQEIKDRREVIRLFHNTTWNISYGSTIEGNYFGVFQIDGTFVGVNASYTDLEGSYTFNNGKLVIDDATYSYINNEFVSDKQFEMMEGRGNYYVSPSDEDAYHEIISSKEYQSHKKDVQSKETIYAYFSSILQIAGETLERPYEEMESDFGSPISGYSVSGLGFWSFKKYGNKISFQCYEGSDGVVSVTTNIYDIIEKENEAELLRVLADYKAKDGGGSDCYKVWTQVKGKFEGNDNVVKGCYILITNLSGNGKFTAETEVSIISD